MLLLMKHAENRRGTLAVRPICTRLRNAPRKECKNERSELFAEARTVTGGSGRRGCRDKSRTRKKSLRLIFALRTGSGRGRIRGRCL
ncbi:MAG: hypothetical protein B6245_22365 [Desulfobacteraceae bacterium 4572_88]|nr:MAG: hypothetical protein B6245_22365 [Desulfobacteraceae bacterium 4572_88]